MFIFIHVHIHVQRFIHNILCMCLVQMKPVWEVFWAKDLEAIKNSSSGCWGRCTIDAPDSGFPPQITHWSAAGTTAWPQPWCHLTQISGPVDLPWEDQTRKSHSDRSKLHGRWFNTFQRVECSVSWAVQAMPHHLFPAALNRTFDATPLPLSFRHTQFHT